MMVSLLTHICVTRPQWVTCPWKTEHFYGYCIWNSAPNWKWLIVLKGKRRILSLWLIPIVFITHASIKPHFIHSLCVFIFLSWIFVQFIISSKCMVSLWLWFVVLLLWLIDFNQTVQYWGNHMIMISIIRIVIIIINKMIAITIKHKWSII